jgi:hypothetical protein
MTIVGELHVCAFHVGIHDLTLMDTSMNHESISLASSCCVHCTPKHDYKQHRFKSVVIVLTSRKILDVSGQRARKLIDAFGKAG